MIQRIQSVWLLLASLTLLLLLLVPVMGIVEGAKEFWIQATGLFKQENGVTTKIDSFRPLYISVVSLAAMTIGVIFNFKSRTSQKRMIFGLIALIVGISFWIFNFAQRIPGGLDHASYKAGIALPLLAIIFCALAIRGITKDEQLLRSAERLR